MERFAKATYNGTANFRFGDFRAYYRFRYISERPVTVLDTFQLPAQRLSDIGFSYRFSDWMSVNLNVNNLLNDISPTQLTTAIGTRPPTLTDEQLIEQYPNSLTAIQTNAPRSMFLTLTAKF
jgi:outer membrane receptor protein involved in Fe transport